MVNNIVTVNVSQTIAPTPSTLQKTGAFISQGATTLGAGKTALITQLSDLTSILQGAFALASLTWSGGVVTGTTAAPHGFANGQQIQLTISGAVPSGYNGTYICTITGASLFTYAHAGTLTTPAGTPGVYTEEDVAELLAMGTTFFAQGAAQAVYVLELGQGDAATGVTALSAYITANPNAFYSYLVPRNWASETTYWAFVANFENPTAKTYFFTTMSLANYTNFTPQMKSVFGLVEAPVIPVTEFSLAAVFYRTLNYDPSTTNKVAPTAFAFLFGVTPYPLPGNSAQLSTLKSAFVNYVGTGAEGGISTAVLFWGTTMDGNDFTYWYSVDWVQINIDLDISNAIIDGSNNPINPLYYNQNGIDRLQGVAASTMSSGVTFGLVLGNVVQTALDGPALTDALARKQFEGQTVVNAVPFIPYSEENPGDYKIGKYSGFSISYTPARGFLSIIFNVNVSQFVAA